MTNADRLNEIKKRLASAQTPRPDDVSFLLSMIEDLEKKNKVLSAHVLELTQEIENTKSDFGSEFR